MRFCVSLTIDTSLLPFHCHTSSQGFWAKTAYALILKASSVEFITIEVKRPLSPKLSRVFSGSALENSTEIACDAPVVEGLADDGAVEPGHGVQAVQVFRAGDSAAGDEVAVQE